MPADPAAAEAPSKSPAADETDAYRAGYIVGLAATGLLGLFLLFKLLRRKS